MRIRKIVKYRMDEQFQNLLNLYYRKVRNIEWTNNSKICQFLEPNFGPPNSKNSRNLLILQILKLQKFPEFHNFENP